MASSTFLQSIRTLVPFLWACCRLCAGLKNIRALPAKHHVTEQDEVATGWQGATLAGMRPRIGHHSRNPPVRAEVAVKHGVFIL